LQARVNFQIRIVQRSLTDFAKIIAAIAVIGIHATSTAESQFAATHEYLSLDFAAVVVNQWARFSVPVFIYLSAYGLTKSYRQAEASFISTYFQFIIKRLPTILVPYFAFSAIALWLNSANLTTADALIKLVHGGADYHLYFLVILAQCYLLFPILIKLEALNPRRFSWLVLGTFLLVVLLLYKTTSERVLPILGLKHPGWHASFCIYWLPYFLLGILHGRREPTPWKLRSALAASAISLTLVLYDYNYYSLMKTPVDYYNHFSRPYVALYALSIIYLLHTLSARMAERHAPAGAWISTLSGLTFSVYLIHPQVLRVLNIWGVQWPDLIKWLCTVGAAFLLVYLVTRGTIWLSERTPAIIKSPLHFVQRALGLR
jgi:probable poly-beta-1,6-N-acetyl-D-glucosamine export protein